MYELLLEFAAVPNISDPIIEKKDIFLYYHANLRWMGRNPTEAQIHNMMQPVWGDDWKKNFRQEYDNLAECKTKPADGNLRASLSAYRRNWDTGCVAVGK